MKTLCEFCKTEYNLTSKPVSPVQCAVCGHIWTISFKKTKNLFMIFIAAISALMAAGIFTLVIIAKYKYDEVKKNPLVTDISEIKTTLDEFGIKHFVVTGTIKNRSDEIYGLPYIVVTSLDNNKNIISSQSFMPCATLLDPGAECKFENTLTTSTDGVKKVTVSLKK